MNAPGEVSVFVADERHDGDHPVDGARFGRLAEQVLGARGVRGEAELALRFVDTEAMAELNQRFLGGEGPTDVLAFPLDDGAAEPGRAPDNSTRGPDRPPPTDGPPLLLGDVVVCPAVAAANAAERQSPYDDELALLVVHGVLHVLGMDHAGADDRAAMQAAERDLLDRFHRGQ